MALTYYIRSWDPRSTYPTNPQEGDICYTITLDQTWAPVGGVKKDNIVKEEVYQNGAWVEQGGGGGGETAKITITNTSGGGWTLRGALAITMFGISTSISSITPDGETVLITGGQWDVFLYEGNAFVELQPEYAEQQLSISGDVTAMGSGFMVTGDCTFTISL